MHLKHGAAPETDKNFKVPVPSFDPFLNRYSQHPEILSILMLFTYMTKLKLFYSNLLKIGFLPEGESSMSARHKGKFVAGFDEAVVDFDRLAPAMLLLNHHVFRIQKGRFTDSRPPNIFEFHFTKALLP